MYEYTVWFMRNVFDQTLSFNVRLGTFLGILFEARNMASFSTDVPKALDILDADCWSSYSRERFEPSPKLILNGATDGLSLTEPPLPNLIFNLGTTEASFSRSRFRVVLMLAIFMLGFCVDPPCLSFCPSCASFLSYAFSPS